MSQTKMGDDNGPDMENRDPNNLNQHVKVVFDEVLGEPDGVRSIDCVWRLSYKCFNGTLSCCYKFLTILCGLPLAFCWGCEFACTACYHVWYLTPYLRCYEINLMAMRKIFSACLEAFVAPFCETCGLFFSRIVVKQ